MNIIDIMEEIRFNGNIMWETNVAAKRWGFRTLVLNLKPFAISKDVEYNTIVIEYGTWSETHFGVGIHFLEGSYWPGESLPDQSDVGGYGRAAVMAVERLFAYAEKIDDGTLSMNEDEEDREFFRKLRNSSIHELHSYELVDCFHDDSKKEKTEAKINRFFGRTVATMNTPGEDRVPVKMSVPAEMLDPKFWDKFKQELRDLIVNTYKPDKSEKPVTLEESLYSFKGRPFPASSSAQEDKGDK